jgi:hypothetical protein
MPSSATNRRPAPGLIARTVGRMPPTSFFLTSAVFHYLGPSLAVLLFVHVHVLGVAWLRIASAAVVFALWRRPWRVLRTADRSQPRHPRRRDSPRPSATRGAPGPAAGPGEKEIACSM